MIDIFGQRHGRKNFFSFKYVLDNIETVDRIKNANFELSYFSNDSSFIRWELMNVCVCIPKSTPTLSGVAYFSRTREVTPSPLPPKSEGARTPIVTLKEVALFWFELQSMFSESCEDSVKSLDVLVKSIRMHIDVVQYTSSF